MRDEWRWTGEFYDESSDATSGQAFQARLLFLQAEQQLEEEVREFPKILRQLYEEIMPQLLEMGSPDTIRALASEMRLGLVMSNDDRKIDCYRTLRSWLDEEYRLAFPWVMSAAFHTIGVWLRRAEETDESAPNLAWFGEEWFEAGHPRGVPWLRTYPPYDPEGRAAALRCRGEELFRKFHLTSWSRDGFLDAVTACAESLVSAHHQEIEGREGVQLYERLPIQSGAPDPIQSFKYVALRHVLRANDTAIADLYIPHRTEIGRERRRAASLVFGAEYEEPRRRNSLRLHPA